MSYVLAVHTSLHHLLFPNRIMSDYIRCVSGALANSSYPNSSDPNSSDASSTSMGTVVVFIDNAIVNMRGVEFEYRDDPVYSSASPQMIIPA